MKYAAVKKKDDDKREALEAAHDMIMIIYNSLLILCYVLQVHVLTQQLPIQIKFDPFCLYWSCYPRLDTPQGKQLQYRQNGSNLI